MRKPKNQQLEMDLKAGEAVRPFELVDRVNYNMTSDVFKPFKDKGNRGLAVLRLAEYGFLSTEISRHRKGLADLGVPHTLLLGMTNSEEIALYSGIGRFKGRRLRHEDFSGKPVEECISELVRDAFSFIPAQFQEIAKQHPVDGYNTKPGGLIDRMRYLVSKDPSLETGFRKSALSTFRILDEERGWIWHSGFDEVVDNLVFYFRAKYQRAASQPINNPR